MNKKLNKKADVATLALIIIVLASASVIGGFVYKASVKAKATSEIEACRLSILAAAQSKKFMAGSPVAGPDCPRRELGDVVLKKKNIVENGLINQDKAHRIIADAMAECWYMVGEGLYDPFANWDEEGSYCLVCKTIYFDDDLLEYYKETFTDQKLQKKRGNNGVILSPIPYLLNHEYKKGQTYFEYIYKEKDPKYSQEDINKMNQNFLAPDSQIIVKLYKSTDKDVIATIATWGTIIVGGVLVIVGVLLSLTGIGAAIGVPLSGAGLTMLKIGAAIVVVGGVITLVGGGILTGVVIFDPVNLNPFSECEECNGIGSIKLIPPDFDLYQEVTIDYGEVKIKGKEREIKEEGHYCMLLVN